jgi:Cu2+-exporting ATPase
VHILSFSAFGYWMWATGGDVRYAINISAAVLIITCPCALGLAVPAVITSASGRLFRKGLLIKHGTALERLAEVDTVVFDKTGTLTLGTPEPVALADHPVDAVALAAALAAGSSHPLARALADGARAGHRARRRDRHPRSPRPGDRRPASRAPASGWAAPTGAGPPRQKLPRPTCR